MDPLTKHWLHNGGMEKNASVNFTRRIIQMLRGGKLSPDDVVRIHEKLLVDEKKIRSNLEKKFELMNKKTEVIKAHRDGRVNGDVGKAIGDQKKRLYRNFSNTLGNIRQMEDSIVGPSSYRGIKGGVRFLKDLIKNPYKRPILPEKWDVLRLKRALTGSHSESNYPSEFRQHPSHSVKILGKFNAKDQLKGDYFFTPHFQTPINAERRKMLGDDIKFPKGQVDGNPYYETVIHNSNRAKPNLQGKYFLPARSGDAGAIPIESVKTTPGEDVWKGGSIQRVIAGKRGAPNDAPFFFSGVPKASLGYADSWSDHVIPVGKAELLKKMKGVHKLYRFRNEPYTKILPPAPS
jgi:hypothetical protein